jgi:hypothetical protein
MHDPKRTDSELWTGDGGWVINVEHEPAHRGRRGLYIERLCLTFGGDAEWRTSLI